MKHFGRVLKIAAKKHWSLVGVLFSSLVIAILWGANIGTLYPMIEVVFQGESIPQYAERRIQESDQTVLELDEERSKLKSKIANATADETDQLNIQIESPS